MVLDIRLNKINRNCLTLQGASRLVAVLFDGERGKSGLHRAPYFLTGRGQVGDDLITESATENIPSRPDSYRDRDKGEKVG